MKKLGTLMAVAALVAFGWTSAADAADLDAGLGAGTCDLLVDPSGTVGDEYELTGQHDIV